MPVGNDRKRSVLNSPEPANIVMRQLARQFSERTEMASDHLRSGYGVLQYEIAEERASALARLGQRLEDALTALAAYPRTANSDRKIRDRLVEQAGYALWLFVVQREACGLNKIDHVIQIYRVPNEVIARMGPLPMPSSRPTRTKAIAEARAPLF
jgi:plasmid stabilization system protein ParE